jgi:hypothetical protein
MQTNDVDRAINRLENASLGPPEFIELGKFGSETKALGLSLQTHGVQPALAFRVLIRNENGTWRGVPDSGVSLWLPQAKGLGFALARGLRLLVALVGARRSFREPSYSVTDAPANEPSGSIPADGEVSS